MTTQAFFKAILFLLFMGTGAVFTTAQTTMVNLSANGKNGAQTTWTNSYCQTVRIRITATGGGGGGSLGEPNFMFNGSTGATLVGEFDIAAGETLRAIAGGQGETPTTVGNSHGVGGGGGAGSGVVNTSTNALLILAAGGTGASWLDESIGGSAATDGNGSGGSAGEWSTGGGGLNSDGLASGGNGCPATGGKKVSLTGISPGSENCFHYYTAGDGGSGMGGGGGASDLGGGGGGHTGGGGGNALSAAKSFNAGLNQTNTNGAGNATPNNGTVLIQLLTVLPPNTPPTVTCKNTTLLLDANGTATLAANAVMQSSSDNCGPVTVVSVVPNTFNCSQIGNQVVTLTVSDAQGLTTTCTANVEVDDDIPPVISCKNASVALNAAGTASIAPADVFQSGTDNCGTVNPQAVSPNSFTCDNLGANTVFFTANDGHGNLRGCSAAVVVTENTPPVVTCKNASVNLNAAGNASIAPIDVFQSGSDNCGTVNPQSVVPGSFNCSNVGANLVTFTANDGHGNTATCTATVTVVDAIYPTLQCKSITANAGATGSVTVAPADVFQSGSDNCGTVNLVSVTPNTFTCSELGFHLVYLSATDASGNPGYCSANVTVVDNTAPAVACKNATVTLNASGAASITTADVFQSGSDVCGAVNPVSVAPSTFNCGNLGANTVTFTANDGNGNTASCTATVTVVDNIAPTVVCKNTAVNLSAAGTAAIAPTDVFQSGADNCGTVNLVSVTPNAFTCSNWGENTVTLTVNDGHGNTSTCTATVAVGDLLNPTALCKNVNIGLNAAGTASITPAAVFLSGADNCGTVNLVSLSPNTFSCNNLGDNIAMLTIDDGHGNQGVCYSLVTVVDNVAPTVVCKNATVNLGATGSAGITPSSVFQSGADNCGIVNVQAVSPNTFSCNNLGNNMVTLTVDDGHGNTAQCQATVTVRDLITPVAQCKNVTANLGATGSVTVAPASVNNGSSDNCGIASMSLANTTFNCAHIGANLVKFTVSDAAGNTSTCNATITVKDQTAPTASCKNATIYLNSQGQATLTPAAVNNNSTDNCGITSMSLTQTNFTCANLSGSTIAVAMTLKDAANNTSSCVAQITVRDNLAPEAFCENTTIQLNAQGKATVYSADLAGESLDNCNIASFSPASKLYTTANLGTNNLAITVKDWSNNASTCTAQITVLPYGGGNAEQPGAAVRAQAAPDNGAALTLYPNPTTTEANVQFQLDRDESVELYVCDANGRFILNRRLDGTRGDNRVTLQVGEWPAGVYFIDLRSKGRQSKKRLVVQRD